MNDAVAKVDVVDMVGGSLLQESNTTFFQSEVGCCCVEMAWALKRQSGATKARH